MATGPRNWLRLLARLALLIAILDGVMAVSFWVLPIHPGGVWAGKRLIPSLSQPAPTPGKPNRPFGLLQRQIRFETYTLYNLVRPAGFWFGVAGLFYLAARRSRATQTPGTEDESIRGEFMPRFLRFMGAVGMIVATLASTLAVLQWASPVGSGGPWLVKRDKDFILQPKNYSGNIHGDHTLTTFVGDQYTHVSRSGLVNPGEMPLAILQVVRIELAALLGSLRPYSVWFCLSGILYLSARRAVRRSGLET